MKILFCYIDNICESGMTTALKNIGHKVEIFDRAYSNHDTDIDYIKILANRLYEHPVDLVFTVNYIPIVSKTCKILNIKYVSWIVDSPCLTLQSKSVSEPHNYIFSFDKIQVDYIAPRNPGHVFHLPLGFCPTDINLTDIQNTSNKKYSCDVSFVGSFHTKLCEYNKIEKDLPPYVKGYADALISAQRNVYGYNFLADSIDDNFIKLMKQYANWGLLSDYIEDDRMIVADIFLGYKCTEQERIHTLNAVSKHFNLDIYTTEDKTLVPMANYKGIADSKTMMPYIFNQSKINLNISNRPIKSGIPLRCFDVMGVGGFLLSNYQPELAEYFIPGEELVLYDSIEDLLLKINYYLTHEEERIRIARNGQKKVLKQFTYEKAFEKIIETII